jgi:DNA-binding CsgD family transcriptional regulator
MSTRHDLIAGAAHLLQDHKALATAAAEAFSKVGGPGMARVCAAGCIVAASDDDVTIALARAGEPLRLAPSRTDALRSRYVDPHNVPLAQRDRFIDPVGSGFVSMTTAKATPLPPLFRALGVQRVLRQHVCIGPRLVAGLFHLSPREVEPSLVALETLAATWRPLLRAAVLLRQAILASHAAPRAPAELTPRQSQIARLVGEGLTNAQVAARLRLSPHTVKTVLHRLYDAYGARNRVTLLRALSSTRPAHKR